MGADFDEAAAGVVEATEVAAAAEAAGGGAFEGADAGVEFAAEDAAVEVFSGGAARAGQVEGVAARFAGDAEVGAGFAPFAAVGGGAAVAVAGEDVGEFVEEGALDFVVADLKEGWVEVDGVAAEVGPAGGGAEAVVPGDAHRGLWVAAEGGEECAGAGFEEGVTPECVGHLWGRF